MPTPEAIRSWNEAEGSTIGQRITAYAWPIGHLLNTQANLRYTAMLRMVQDLVSGRIL